jgi:hypothetical protein
MRPLYSGVDGAGKGAVRETLCPAELFPAAASKVRLWLRNWSQTSQVRYGRTGFTISRGLLLRGYRDLAALVRTLDRTAMDSRKEVA